MFVGSGPVHLTGSVYQGNVIVNWQFLRYIFKYYNYRSNVIIIRHFGKRAVFKQPDFFCPYIFGGFCPFSSVLN